MKIKKKISKNKSLKELYKESFAFIKESRNCIYLAIGLFLVFALVGYFVPPTQEIEDQILALIRGLSVRFEGLNTFETIWEIFSNNLTVSFTAIIFGLAFGFMPLFVAIFNGYLVGYVANYAVSQKGILILWKLFPHGIFELPAVLIAVGLGIRVGFSIFKEKEKTFVLLKKSLQVFLLVILALLVVAAVIEGILVSLA